MNVGRIESGLARFTLGALVIYVPVETWASLPDGLWNPFYLVDLIAMVLLFVGALRSLRLRPASAPGILCAGYAWEGANFWRATFGRLLDVLKGGSLTYGIGELWVVGAATILVLGCFAATLLLVTQAERARNLT